MKPPTSNQLVRPNLQVSRRDLLGTLLGTAGFALLPSSANAQKPTPHHRPHPVPPPRVGDANGVQRWSTLLQNSQIISTYSLTSALYFGGVVYATVNDGTNDGVFLASDTVDGHAFFILPPSRGVAFSGDIVSLPAFNSVFSLCTDNQSIMGFNFGNMSSLSTFKWHGSLPVAASSNVVVVNGDTIVYVGTDNTLTGLQFTSGSSMNKIFSPTLSSSGNFNNATLQAVSSNSFLIVQPNSSGGSMAYYASPSGLIVPAFPVEFATGPFIVAPPCFYCLIDDGSNWAITQHSITNDPNFNPWNYDREVSDSLQTGNLVSYNNSVYFAASDGNIHSVDLNTGNVGATIKATGAYLSKLFIQNGAALYCSQNTAYAVDLASNGESSVSYTFPSLSKLMGIENGVAIILTEPSEAPCLLHGVDLASELRGYSCDSVLMAEDYTGSGPNYGPGNPGYRTTLQLLDQNNNPRAGIAVRIEASDSVKIVSGGTTYNLANAGDAAWLTTDSGGNLDFVSLATDIQSPALYVWATFMDQNEAIVIYPDHQALTKLANSQAGDYQSGTDFLGNPILPSNVPAGYVAQTVQNVLGASLATPPQLAANRGPLRATANSYSQYPATATNLLYQAQKGATARTFNQGSAASFTATIGDDGSFSFQSGVAEMPELNSALFLSFSQFKSDIVKAGKKIKSFAVAVASDVTHTITAIDDTIYQFTITCIEDAVTALTGLFKTIFSDISKAVEFLSTLFEWGAITTNHQAILTRVSKLQTSLRQYLTSDSDKLKTRLHTMFSQWENAVDPVSSVDSQVGGSSTKSSQQNGNDPKQVFGSGGGYAQAKGFQSKLRDNAKAASTPLIPTTLPLTPQAAFSTIQNLIQNQIPTAITPVWDDLKQAITDFLSGFKTLFIDPMNFVTQSFHDLLTLLRGVIKLLIQAVDLASELVITALADLIDTIFSLLTGSFQIPILSDLFQAIFGQPLRLIDLAAWVIAVPVTIVQKVSSVTTPGKLGNATQDLFAGISTIIGAAIDAFNDSSNLDPSSPLNWIDLAAGILTAGLAFPTDADFTDDAQIVYYALGFIPLLLSGANAINATILSTFPRTEEQQAQVDAFNASAYYLTGILGLVLLCFTVEAHALNSPAFGSNTLAPNAISNVGLMAKYFDLSAPQITVVADLVCPTTAAIINFANS